MFDVEWTETATTDLAAIYLAHPQQRADIDPACNRIDRILEHAGPSAGTVISQEGLAKLRCEPLEVLFEFVGIHIEVQTVKWIGFGVSDPQKKP